MHLHLVVIRRGCALTFGNDLVLKTALRGHDTFSSLVLGEECFTFGLALFSSEAILSHLFSLTVLRKLVERFHDDGIVHQELCRIAIVAFLESLNKEIQVEINGITSNELETSLVTKMGTKSVAVLVLFSHKRCFFGRCGFARFATRHKHGKSASCNNQFSLHFYPL